MAAIGSEPLLASILLALYQHHLLDMIYPQWHELLKPLEAIIITEQLYPGSW
jgi:hypothetical protein